nr:MFS transporter [Vibrio sonorensis]
MLRRVYIIAALSIVAHFAAFTYIEVLLSGEYSVSSEWVVIYLFTFGGAGLVGNVICGLFIDRSLASVLSTGLLTIGLSFGLISLVPLHNEYLLLVVIAAWGLGGAMLFVALQTWIIRLAKHNALTASAIYAAIFNAAIGTGAVLGSGVLSISTINVLFLVASFIVLVSLSLVITKHHRTADVVID